MSTVKLRVHKNSIFMALLIITYGIRAITDAVFVARGIDSPWVGVKYITLLIAIVYGFCYMLQSGRQWKCLYLLKQLGVVAVVLVSISFLRMFYAGVFSTAPFKVAFYIMLPAIVGILSMSILDSDDIYNCFAWILITIFPIYCVFEIGLEVFSLAEFARISFANSFSPFESHYTSGTAMALCVYFAYYRKRKCLTVLSFVFALLTFKRLFVLFGIFIILLPRFVDLRKRVRDWVPVCAAVVCCVFTIMYYWMMIPQNQEILADLLNIQSLRDFTSGRSAFFEEVYSGVFFVNFGLGSIEAYLGRSLEMDLIQLLIETTFVGLAVFSFAYWKLAGKTYFGIVFMAFNFLNMLTSHSFQNGFIWSLTLIALLQSEEESLGNMQCGSKRIQLYVKRYV